MSERLNLKRIVEPQNLPLSLGEAKAFLKIEDDQVADEATVMALLRAAVRHVETYTGRLLITQTWRLTRDGWPRRTASLDQDWEGVREGVMVEEGASFIEIPRPPLQSVTAVKLYDSADTESDVASTVYFVDTDSEPGRVGLRTSQTWPATTLRPHAGIQITFVAGYGDHGATIPDDIMAGLRLVLAHFYDNRAACDPASNIALPVAAEEALRPYRIVKV